MRNRKLLAGVVLAVVAVMAFGRVAGAQEAEPSGPKDEFTEECIHLLEEGGDIDDCQEAPSPIKPATNELIWGTLSFVVLFALLWKLAWPGIKKGMQARTERIRADVSSAEQAKGDAQSVLEEYRAQLADARNEGARIVDEARQQAEALRAEQMQRLNAELGELRQRAAEDIEASRTRAIVDLREQVASIAIGAAERVVERSLDRQTQLALVESYINEVGARQ